MLVDLEEIKQKVKLSFIDYGGRVELDTITNAGSDAPE
jgi:hypothetical protein